jgi:hypothetical protein
LRPMLSWPQAALSIRVRATSVISMVGCISMNVYTRP